MSTVLKTKSATTWSKSLLCIVACSTVLHTQAAEVMECQIANYKSELLAAVNDVRAKGQVCGAAVGALALNDKLNSVAAAHSKDMANQQFFSHANIKGERIGKRARKFGYAYTVVGENIAAGQGSVAEVMDTWLNSPSHCGNIMTAEFVHMGISCQYNAKTEYQYYWTLTLGSPKP